jgi:class 3 adenylate cyclase
MESRHLAVMMTDIQGFTRATSGMGREQVEELLALHEDLLVPVIKENGGTIVKGLGDAFLVTFESPTRGVQAGVRIQEVLAEHNAEAEDGKQLRVRVALNAGEVNIRDGDVFGEAVNITARVEGVCAAEQVTLTEAVFLLLEKEAVETEYLEEVELKGIPFPVKLYRVLPDWLPPEDRDVSRARSKPAAKGGAEGEADGGAARAGMAVGGLAALVALGVWLAQPAPAHVLLEEAAQQKRDEEVFRILDKGLRESPTPELRAAAARYGQASLAALQEGGKWQEALELQTRLTERIPGVEGLTRPQDRVALARKGIHSLRAGQHWAKAAELREALLGIDRLEGDEDLLRWAREDLERLWDERCPPGEPAPEDLERRIAAPEVTKALERLKKRDHDDPFLILVQAVRAGFSASASRFAERWKALSEALTSSPELARRRELEPALRIFCESQGFPDGGYTDAWTWAEPMVQRKLGDWVDGALEGWVNLPAPKGNSPDELVAHLRLRRHALRLATRRGVKVRADAGLHARADARVLTARPKSWNHDRTMAELQDLVLRIGTLTEEERQSVEPLMRKFLEARLGEADASPTARENFTRAAGDLGFDDLVQPHRELLRDLEWALGRVNDYNFRPYEYLENFTKARLARVVPGIPEPWKGSLSQLLSDWAEPVKKRFPAVQAELEKARKVLAEP